MYDRPETRDAWDAFWNLTRLSLGCDAPLSRNGDLWEQWRAPNLLLSQTCGLPYRAMLHSHVTLVGTPIYADLACAPGHYFSVLISRRDDDRRRLEDFSTGCLAYNEDLSQSGWAAPQSMTDAAGFAFSSILKTGAHRASAIAVADRRADIAAIDALTWAHISRWDDFAENLHVICESDPTPALPFITSESQDATQIRIALTEAFDMIDADHASLLGMSGLALVPKEEYLRIPLPRPPEKRQIS